MCTELSVMGECTGNVLLICTVQYSTVHDLQVVTTDHNYLTNVKSFSLKKVLHCVVCRS